MQRIGSEQSGDVSNKGLIFFIWLTLIPGIGCITQHRLLDYFQNPENIYEANTQQLLAVPGIKRNQVEQIQKQRSLEPSMRVMDSCSEKRISIMTVDSLWYPKKAGLLEDAPIVLYYQGKPKNLEKSIAIVGTRNCTQETKWVTAEKTQEYVKQGYGIISGMAKGVDSYAHTACLKSDGYTVAVLGNGPDICYPKEHQRLMESIVENGLILSEYSPGTEPARFRFPRRNRIISAWADEILIIGAGRYSGTRSTEEYAKQYGREIEKI